MIYKTDILELAQNKGFTGVLYKNKHPIIKTQNYCAPELAITALNNKIDKHNETFGLNIPHHPQIKVFDK